jgi:carbonic anhydrase
MSGLGILALLAGLCLIAPLGVFAGSPGAGPMDGAQALRVLLEGNARFAAGKPQHPNQDTARRAALKSGQHPLAAILSCSDSRVPPTVVFDQGLGDLFVVRVAGNTADDLGLASIDYAVKQLGTRLIVVLGHDNCGAVMAAVKEYKKGDHGPMLRPIRPAVAKTMRHGGDVISDAIDENVRLTVDRLRQSAEFAPMVKKGDLKIVGARYDFESGRVQVFSY